MAHPFITSNNEVLEVGHQLPLIPVLILPVTSAVDMSQRSAVTRGHEGGRSNPNKGWGGAGSRHRNGSGVLRIGECLCVQGCRVKYDTIHKYLRALPLNLVLLDS